MNKIIKTPEEKNKEIQERIKNVNEGVAKILQENDCVLRLGERPIQVVPQELLQGEAPLEEEVKEVVKKGSKKKDGKG